MAKVLTPVTTINEEKKMDDLRVVHVKNEQEIVNAAIDTGAQESVVRANVVEGQSIDNGGTIQITSAFGEHEMAELKIFDMEINGPRHGVVLISKKLVNGMLICSSDYEGWGSFQQHRRPGMTSALLKGELQEFRSEPPATGKVLSRRKQRLAFDQVSEFGRGRIVAFRNCGLSFREIGSRVARNQTTAIRICDLCMQEGTTDRLGLSHPPQCKTLREDIKLCAWESWIAQSHHEP
ncbi:HTH_Tnp_Tc3_2 domain-containing protein [Trichonephila clavipes]|nr:HTH_Tnp_Tc3_2 domain-containing protein [Trichonephila clavipes]